MRKGIVLVLALLVVAGMTAEAATVPRPHIVWKPIPFGPKRRAEMAAYSRRHYGFRRWRLVRPKVIVEHYTASSTFSSAYYTFYSDNPDAATHQLPNVCAHFIVDKDGTIYQLVNLKTMCRHTVGLNWTSIGIEHVGWSDGEILRNPRQIAASLRLTLWLTQRFHIKLQNVIGHAEALSSPYHHERVAAQRCDVHGDWSYADMTVYRGRLRRLARRYGIDLGRLPKQRPSKC